MNATFFPFSIIQYFSISHEMETLKLCVFYFLIKALKQTAATIFQIEFSRVVKSYPRLTTPYLCIKLMNISQLQFPLL